MTNADFKACKDLAAEPDWTSLRSCVAASVCASSDWGAKANPDPDGFGTQNQNAGGVCCSGPLLTQRDQLVLFWFFSL